MKQPLYILLSILILLVSCQSQPKHIIQKDDMLELLIDIHKTEAVITLNHHQYPGDEKKRALREAVYMRHNTNKEQFDSSMVWYGNHLDVYIDIYDQVIARLNEENDELKDLIKQEEMQVLTQEGDTVDIWQKDRKYIFDSHKGNNVLSFTINNDENFKRNDRFSLRFHVVNMPTTGEDIKAYIAIRHNDLNVNYNYTNVQRSGWTVLNVQSDSVANLSEIYGYITMPPRNDGYIMYVDSIQLIRMHEKVGMSDYEYKVMNYSPSRKENDTKKESTKEKKKSDKKKQAPQKPIRNKSEKKKIEP